MACIVVKLLLINNEANNRETGGESMPLGSEKRKKKSSYIIIYWLHCECPSRRRCSWSRWNPWPVGSIFELWRCTSPIGQPTPWHLKIRRKCRKCQITLHFFWSSIGLNIMKTWLFITFGHFSLLIRLSSGKDSLPRVSRLWMSRTSQNSRDK